MLSIILRNAATREADYLYLIPHHACLALDPSYYYSKAMVSQGS